MGNAGRAGVASLGMGASLLLACSPAFAQTSAPRQLRTVFAQAVAGNQERVTILPSLNVAYETNALPYNTPAQGGSDGNGRITPGIDIAINKLFGRTRVYVAGNAGYDFNTRYKFYDQPRLSLSSGATFFVGSPCTVSAAASYQQRRFDQQDLVQNTDATSRTQAYDLSGRCDRAVGFSPSLGASYVKQTSDDFKIFNYDTYGLRGGVSYYRPSLGALTLSGGYQQTQRPGIRRLTGLNDDTSVYQINLTLSRSVSPRIQFSAGGGYFIANPKRAGLSSTSGASYNGDITARISPALIFTASAGREITNESGISATYVRRDDFRAGLRYQLTRASALDFSAQRTYRRFRGEDILNPSLPIGRDRVTQASAYYSLDMLRRFRFSVGARQLWRNGDNDFFDYKSTTFSASVGARF